jgi:carbon monoxide dehydrogenase subunit G
MQLETSFAVGRSRDEVVEILFRYDSLVALLPGRSKIIARGGHRKTTSTQYTALGRDGTAIFHFDFLLDGNIRFTKECDGVVWEELGGEVRVEEENGETHVWISMEGRTKPMVPEFAIKSPMEDQLLQMAEALEALL